MMQLITICLWHKTAPLKTQLILLRFLSLPCLDGVGIIVIILSIWSNVDVPGKSGFPATQRKIVLTKGWTSRDGGVVIFSGTIKLHNTTVIWQNCINHKTVLFYTMYINCSLNYSWRHTMLVCTDLKAFLLKCIPVTTYQHPLCTWEQKGTA